MPTIRKLACNRKPAKIYHLFLTLQGTLAVEEAMRSFVGGYVTLIGVQNLRVEEISTIPAFLYHQQPEIFTRFSQDVMNFA